MKITVRVPMEIDADAIRVIVPVKDGEMPDDYPGRHGNQWDVTIDIETGQIRKWPKGVPAFELNMDVRKDGSYYLLDVEGKELDKLENEYVPFCFPAGGMNKMYLSIDEYGFVTNWDVDSELVEDSFFLGDDQ